MSPRLLLAFTLSLAFLAPAHAQQVSNDPAQNLRTLTAIQRPTLISTSMTDAVNAILNETTAIDALIGPIPRELHAALERAAIRTPVTLISGAASTNVPFSQRIKFKRTNAESDSSIIVLTKTIVFFQNGRTQLLSAPVQTPALHTRIQESYKQLR